MKFFKSLRFRLILLVLISVIPALGITLYSGLEQRRMAQQQAFTDASRYTRLVADYEVTLVENTRRMMQSVALSAELTDPEHCTNYLKSLHRIYPMYGALLVAAPDGQVFCTSVEVDPTVNLADRPYVQRALITNDIVIGDPVMGRLSKIMVLPIALSVMDEDLGLPYVFIVSVDLDQLGRFAAAMDLPPQSAILLVNRQGTILYRYPESEPWVGKTMPDVPLIRQILADSLEGRAETVGLDNVDRLFAYNPLQSTLNDSVYVSIGISSDLVYAGADQTLRIDLLWMAAAALLALAAAWFGGEFFFLRVVSLTAERDAAERKLKEANAMLEARVEERTAELSQVNEQLQTELVERKRMVKTLRQRETELRRTMKLLEKSNRDLQDFAYITSHDLQEPLRKIQAFSERLVNRYSGQLGEEGSLFVNRMNTSAHRLQVMINDLLDYSRVSTRGREFAPVQLEEVVCEAVAELDLLIRETNGQVVVEDLPVVEGDRSQLCQLFQNLIANALKFHRVDTAPTVLINGELIKPDEDCENSQAVIWIRDNGIGFDEKYLDRIFLPFQRLHGRDVYEGSGIGLAICRRIADRHGGTITAKSVLNQGSSFIVKLPVQHMNKEE